jgi:hypothetical protein
MQPKQLADIENNESHQIALKWLMKYFQAYSEENNNNRQIKIHKRISEEDFTYQVLRLVQIYQNYPDYNSLKYACQDKKIERLFFDIPACRFVDTDFVSGMFFTIVLFLTSA